MTPPLDDTCDVTIDQLGVGGDGCATLGTLNIFVPFTLPGERVRIRLPKGRVPGGGPVTARLI